MSKVICHKKGKLFIKCKNCGNSWTTQVALNDVVDDTCPNCGTQTQYELVVMVEDTKSKGASIPEFMEKPRRFITLTEEEHAAIHHKHTELVKKHYQLGFNKGLTIGISIGLLVLLTILVLLFVPLNIIPV